MLYIPWPALNAYSVVAVLCHVRSIENVYRVLLVINVVGGVWLLLIIIVWILIIVVCLINCRH